MFHTYFSKKELEVRFNRALAHHPLAAFLLFFAGLPMCVLMAVSLITMVLVYPTCLLLGLM